MKVLSKKKYDEMQTAKWAANSKAYWEKAPSTQASLTQAPQLAFYLFATTRKYGYVAFDEKTALWDKSKKGVIEYWENEQIRRKIRGY